jgi:uncharacterized protein YecT (DUF1311 family)
MKKQIAALAVAFLLSPALLGHAHAAKVDHYYSKTYNDCMDTAGGSTMPMKFCIGAEDDSWDKQLNVVYQALMAGRAGPDKIKLRDEERAWLARTARKCDHAGDDDAGGSLQTVDIDMCNLDEKILRTIYLRGLH